MHMKGEGTRLARTFSEGLETKLHAARIVVPIPRCVTTLFWDIL